MTPGPHAGTLGPRWILAPAALAVLLVGVPLAGLLTRVPWDRVPALLATPAALDALRVSLTTCAAATVLSVALGLPLALTLARRDGRLAGVVRTLVTIPMVLPPVVAGLALLVTLGRRGPVGGVLASLGWDIGFTPVAVVLAQTFVAMPYLVTSVEGALRTRGDAAERVAATLGAGPTYTLLHVTLPTIAPAVASGAALAFARALGEFGATITFAGSLQGVTRTLPLEIYLAREVDTDAALALALVLVVVAALTVAATGLARRRRVGARSGAAR